MKRPLASDEEIVKGARRHGTFTTKSVADSGLPPKLTHALV
jgi:hypothetical protein